MKRENFSQLKNKSALELKKELAEHRDRLWSLKNDLTAGKVKNVREIRSLKRNIARILTLLKL